MKTFCRQSGKKCFKTHEKALTRAGEILTTGKSDAEELRAYKCDHCGHYHLTHKDPAQLGTKPENRTAILNAVFEPLEKTMPETPKPYPLSEHRQSLLKTRNICRVTTIVCAECNGGNSIDNCGTSAVLIITTNGITFQCGRCRAAYDLPALDLSKTGEGKLV